MTRDTRPVDPEDQRLRGQLNALARVLRQLHSALLDLVRADYESQHAPVKGPVQLFQLVTNDAFFAWLRPLSAEMALIDELIDEKRKLDPADAGHVRRSVETLFARDGQPPEGFAANYAARLHDSGTVGALHGELRETLDALPKL